jgi:S1-C subfamily serine protease
VGRAARVGGGRGQVAGREASASGAHLGHEHPANQAHVGAEHPGSVTPVGPPEHGAPASVTPVGPPEHGAPASVTPVGPPAGKPRAGAAAGGVAAGAAAGQPTRPLPRRYRVLPRTLLGTTAMILALAVGAAFSGVVLYSYYQYRLDQTDNQVNRLIGGYSQAFKNAEAQLNAQANAAKAQIQAQLAPLRQVQAQTSTLTDLVKKLGPSLFFVHTLDRAGQPSVGSAFVVSSNARQSLLLTSYTAVEAATTTPAPPVYVQQGTTSTPVTVRSWDPTYDLALIVLPRGNLPVVTPAPSNPAPALGERVFALSGLGAGGGSISQGAITEVSANGIEFNTPISAAFQGGPLVDSSGQVLGVASRTYAPLGFASDGVWFAPYVNAACQRVISCPGGALPSS